MNKKTKIAIIGIIALVLVTIGVTYAYWLITRTQTGENVITTGCLDITLNGENDITLSDQFPMSDEDGAKLTPYTFTVTNNCNTSVDYQINLESIGDNSNAISADALKVVLNESAPRILSNYTYTDTTVSDAYVSNILSYGTLEAKSDTSDGDEATYELRIWIDEDAQISEMNKTFKSKITVTIGQGISSGIIIDSEEQLYALQRSLLSPALRNIAGYDSTTYTDDLALFEIPDEYTTNEEKIAYLSTATYTLDSDLKVTLTNLTSENQYMSIGTPNYPFKGTFNGNGHTITLSGEALEDTLTTDVYHGLFGYVTDASIDNLNLEVNTNIVLKDTNTTSNIYFGLLGGHAINTDINNVSVEIDNSANVGANLSGDLNLSQVFLGGILGESTSTNINNTTVNIKGNSSINITSAEESHGIFYFAGGIVGKAAYSNIDNAKVNIENSSIGIEVINGNLTTNYNNLAVGGILGFSNHGSDNTNNIGKIGNTLSNSEVNINNSVEKESIFAKEQLGGGVNAGGIVGIAFNNMEINMSDVNVNNGKITAVRSQINETEAKYGAHVGGIIGRLEHTGRIYGCNVKGDNLTIEATGSERQNYSGGIVGVDIGPLHRDVISLENNTFDGNNSSQIKLNILENENIQRYNMVGGIAGSTAYAIKGNSVQNVDLSLTGIKSTDSWSVIGKVIGAFNYDAVWKTTTHFTPIEERGIINSTANNVTLYTDSTAVKQGEVYGYYED